MKCVNCGETIKGKKHIMFGGLYVCNKCHKKIKKTQRLVGW